MITTNSKLYMVWVLLFRSEAGDMSTVGDVFVALGGYIILVNELDCVSVIANVEKALGKTPKFFTIGLSLDGAILLVSCKVFALHELTSFFIEERVKSSKPKG